MKTAVLLLSVVALATVSSSLCGLDTSRPVTERIGILKTPPSRAVGVDQTVKKYLPRYLEESLTEAGFKVTMIGRTIDEMTEGSDHDLLIDIGLSDEFGEPVSAIGAGGSIQGVGVGGEVSVIQASAFAEIRIYNAKTLERLTSLELSGETTQPAFSGIGVSDPSGWFSLRIPFQSKGPLKHVARDIARDAAAVLREEFGK